MKSAQKARRLVEIFVILALSLSVLRKAHGRNYSILCLRLQGAERRKPLIERRVLGLAPQGDFNSFGKSDSATGFCDKSALFFVLLRVKSLRIRGKACIILFIPFKKFVFFEDERSLYESFAGSD